MRNPAAEPGVLDEDADATEQPIVRRRPEPSGDVDTSAVPARAPGVDADTQTAVGPAEWTSLDLRRSMRLLHSSDDAVVKRTLRRLHIRFWHAAASKLGEIFRFAGAPRSTLALVKDIVDTCRICRARQRPPPKSTTTARMARHLNDVVHWDICVCAQVRDQPPARRSYQVDCGNANGGQDSYERHHGDFGQLALAIWSDESAHR